MKTWLQFVGASHYPTPGCFIKEAKAVGVTRVVEKRTLATMSYGDRVVLAQWIKGGKKNKAHAIIFGEFIIDSISGLSEKVLDALSGAYPMELVDMGGQRIVRGCGSYTKGRTVSFTGDRPSPSDIVDTIKGLGIKDKPMVGGRLVEYPKHVRMKNLPHSPGTREFDYDSWRMGVAGGVPRGGLPGQFYAKAGKEVVAASEVVVDLAMAQVVLGYQGA